MRDNGFTLIELMIVVAIVGIITSIAYPSYMGFVKNGKRSAAQADLMALAAAMQRHKAGNYNYKGAAAGGADTGAPSIFHAYSPSSEPASEKQYNLTIDSVNASGTSYVLLATPVSGTAQADDGKLYYFSDGRKGWDKNNNGTLASSEYCWKC
ncbi:type IV pilin protein [Neptunicella marina]|uniref:Prepilin-type N-terminal cleavage/methylation domain-containing protein n=1 Tax=Neptunicella marina TaxID=2125989 RepID=A0A8J6IPB4_9ALTE|nr:type IV pilin protein [Neptunicella marina]MBC3765445.1 prepilin-type N-terminal cleavage/methylation domain-containing protein [Neptunicella marina]